MSKELFTALDTVMREIVGYNYRDEDGICEDAMAVLADYRREMETAYSVRCIEAAMRNRKLAHDLRKSARRYEALYPMPCGSHHAAWYDANTALREAIRWIHAARFARIREHNAAIRESHNEFRAAAE